MLNESKQSSWSHKCLHECCKYRQSLFLYSGMWVWPGSGLATKDPILRLRLGLVSPTSPGSVFTQTAYKQKEKWNLWQLKQHESLCEHWIVKPELLVSGQFQSGFCGSHLILHALGSASTQKSVRCLGRGPLSLILQLLLLDVCALLAFCTLDWLDRLLNALKETVRQINIRCINGNAWAFALNFKIKYLLVFLTLIKFLNQSQALVWMFIYNGMGQFSRKDFLCCKFGPINTGL